MTRFALIGTAALGFILLGAFLWPVCACGSPRMACLSQLKRIGTSVSLYATDHDEQLPIHYTFDDDAAAGSKFISAIRQYSTSPIRKEAFICNEDKADVHAVRLPQVEGSGPLGYEHDLNLTKSFIPSKRVIDLSKIEAPQSVVYLRDPIRSIGVEKQQTLIKSPHGEAFVILFLDTHVRALHLGAKGFYKPSPK
jgi:hypothetical protein